MTDLRSDRGEIHLALYESAARYGGKGEPFRKLVVKATAPLTHAVFEGLAPGTYAIKAFHDLNSDGKLNLLPIGYPSEPFAFSNGAVARLSEPGWRETVFTVGEGGGAQTIRLH